MFYNKTGLLTPAVTDRWNIRPVYLNLENFILFRLEFCQLKASIWIAKCPEKCDKARKWDVIFKNKP